MHRRVLLSAWFVVACAAGVSADDKVTYDQQVVAIFRESCLSCHNAEQKKGDLDLSSYAGLSVGSSSGEVVDAGNADASKLLLVISHRVEPFMPLGKPKLADDKIAVIRKWIEQGLLENSGSVAKKGKPRANPTLSTAPTGKPTDPIALPSDALLEPVVHAPRSTAVTAMAHNPWAPLLAIGGQKQILLYRTDSLSLAGILPFPEGFANSLQFTRNGKYLLAAGGLGAQSGHAVLFDFVTGRRVARVGDEYDAILAADINPEQSIIAIGGPNRLVKGINVASGETIYTIKKHTDWVTSLAFSPDGVLLADGDRNGGLLVSEAANGGLFYDLRGHTAAVTAVSFRSDSNVLASGSEDGTIRLWNMQDGAAIKNWQHGDRVTDVRYALDGKLISTGRDHKVKVWDGDGKLLREFEAFPDIALRGVFNDGGTRVIGADWSGQVRVFNATDGARLGELNPNPLPLALQIAQAEQLVATLAAKQGEWTGNLASLRQDAENITRETNALKQRKADLEGDVMKAAEAELAAARSAHEKAVAEKSETAGQRAADAEAATKKLEGLRAELALMPKRITDGEAAAAGKSQEAGALERTIAEHTAAAPRLKQLRAAVAFTPVFYGRLELAESQSQQEDRMAAVQAAQDVLRARQTALARLKEEIVNGPALIAMREQQLVASREAVAATQKPVADAQAALVPIVAKANADGELLKLKTAEVATMLDALNKVKATVDAAQAAVAKAQADASSLLATVQGTQANILAKQTAQKVVGDVASGKKAELEKLTVDATTKEAELAAARTAAQPKIEALQKSQGDLHSVSQSLDKTTADAKVRLDAIARLKGEHQAKVDALAKARADVQAKLEALQRAMAAAKEKPDDKSLAEAVEARRNEHAVAAAAVPSQETELQSLAAFATELEAEHGTLADLVGKLMTQRQSLAQATQTLEADAKPSIAAVDRLTKEHSALTVRVTALNEETPRLQASVTLLTQELAGMNESVTQLTNQRNGVVERIKTLEAEHRKAMEALAAPAAAHQAAVAAADAAKRQAETSQQAVAAAQVHLEAERKKLNAALEKVASADKELATAKAAVESGPRRIAESEAAVQQAVEAVAAAESAATQAAASVEAVTKKLDEVTAAWMSTKS